MYFTANSAATAGFMDQPPLKFAKARTISLLAECCSYALLHRKRASRRGLFRVLVRVGRDVATLPLTDPYEPISSIRFFTGELRSRRCNGGRSGLLAEDDA